MLIAILLVQLYGAEAAELVGNEDKEELEDDGNDEDEEVDIDDDKDEEELDTTEAFHLVNGSLFYFLVRV